MIEATNDRERQNRATVNEILANVREDVLTILDRRNASIRSALQRAGQSIEVVLRSLPQETVIDAMTPNAYLGRRLQDGVRDLILVLAALHLGYPLDRMPEETVA
jgi:hypothetical protein